MIKHKLPTIFIGIAAVSSLISQSLLDLFSILSIIMVLWIGFEKKMFKELFQKIGIEWAFIGFFITCFVGIVWNTGGFYWEHLKPLVKFNWMIHIYFMIAAFKLWLPKAEDALKLLLGLSLIPSGYAIATKIAGYDFLVPERPLEGRVIGMVNSATYHAHASAILFVFCAALLFSIFNRRKISSWMYSIAFALLAVSIYFTYTRGAILAVVVALLIGLIVRNWKHALFFGIGLATILLFVSKTDPFLSKRVEHTNISQETNSGRIGLLNAHFQMFLDHPALGMGYDIYKNSPSAIEYTKKFNVPEYLHDSHAHNQFLQILSSTGIIGFLFFSTIVIFLFWQSIKLMQIQSKSTLPPLIPAVFWTQGCICLLFLTDQSFEYAKIRFVILAVWALTLTLTFSVGPSNSHSKL